MEQGEDRRIGLDRSITSYVSIGLEKNSRSTNVTAKASIWVTTPLDEEPFTSMTDHATTLANAEKNAIAVANTCAIAFEQLATEAGTTDQVVIDAIKESVNRVARSLVARLPQE